jgi:tRNA modification GTPase
LNTPAEDTIYALSSGAGSAIAVIRISGNRSHEFLLKLFFLSSGKKLRRIRHGQMYYGLLKDPEDGKMIDEVYIAGFCQPRSYTTENMTEIYCHGSRGIISGVFRILQKMGARPATAGEFTKRAFFNGRITLNQAEAIRDLVDAETEEQAHIALNSLKGGLQEIVARLRTELITIIANMEVTIDYPEEDIEFWEREKIQEKLDELKKRLSLLAHSYESYKGCRDGLLTAIIGKPNAGKSSLLNTLLKEERAIVTPIAGTTRDSLEESFLLRGHKFRLVDTAGICNSRNPVEKIGVERSLSIEKNAAIKLYVYDGSTEVRLRQTEQEQNTLHLINKSDLPLHKSALDLQRTPQKRVFFISTLHYEGFEPFLEELIRIAELCSPKQEETMIISQRQQLCLNMAHGSIQAFSASLHSGIPVDVALIDLYEARDQLSQITGKIYTEDILEHIFANFCLGK